MFDFHHALGWGLLFVWITPALAQSAGDSEFQLRPFRNVSITSFEEIWQDPTTGVEHQFSVDMQHPIVLATAEEIVTSGEGSGTMTVPVTDLPTLLPIPTAQQSGHLPKLLSPADTIRAAETGLFEWLFGMLGVVGLVALGGVYWIYQIRPALDVRQTTDRLRLSSALPLPRRSGLFLVDVEDQSVLLAMDGGGIRQVVPLGPGTRMKSTGRRVAADKAQRRSPPSTSEGGNASDELAFHDLLQEQAGLSGDVQTILQATKFATKPKNIVPASKSP
jgi:hypothetical protein